MTRQGIRRRATVIAIALITLSPASPALAAEPACDSTLSPGEITSAGISCRLAATTVIKVAEDLDVTVPERGVVAAVEILRTKPSTAPSTAALYRSADDQLALRIDEEPVVGPATAAAKLRGILTKQPAKAGTPAVQLAAVPSYCGSTSSYAIHPGVWRNGVYPWTYNSRTQPDSGALQAIQYGFKFITDDSSACGSHPTNASADYRGSTTRYTWGTRDNGNVMGWAGFGPGTLAMSYWWYDEYGYTLEGDTAFNNRDTSWYTGLSGTPPSTRYDLITIATHEAGHIFGLSHVSDSNQVMYGYFATGENRRIKRSGDLFGMYVKY
jgi:matrixin